MAIEDYNGLPHGVPPNKMPVSRSAEFDSGTTGGGSTHAVSHSYTPSSVEEPVEGTSNGQSPSTFSQDKILDYYR